MSDGGGRRRALADPAIEAEAAEIMRSQIERITLTPNAEGALDLQLYGELGRMLQFCEAARDKRERAERGAKRERPGRGEPGRDVSAVAGPATPFVCCCSQYAGSDES